MQLATPRLVPIAVRIVMSVWITSFQMSRFSIVPITIYQLQCTIQLFSSPPSQGGSGRVSLSPFWPVTLQRYKTMPRDVKRHPRFGGDLTLSHDGHWQWLWLYNQRHKSPSAIAIRHSQKMHINNCKIGICKDNSCFVQQGGGKDERGAHTMQSQLSQITDNS